LYKKAYTDKQYKRLLKTELTLRICVLTNSINGFVRFICAHANKVADWLARAAARLFAVSSVWVSTF
jgi:hypothetical protein